MPANAIAQLRANAIARLRANAIARLRANAIARLRANALTVLVEEATAVTPELVAAFRRLVPQLSTSSPVPGGGDLAEMVRSPATILLLARDRDAGIVGTLALVVFRIPTGVRAWIEDVVVDGEWRGRGVAEVLCREALNRASARGARTVDLTSRPSRDAANRLYRRLGFVARDTNVYRWSG